jgi:transposase
MLVARHRLSGVSLRHLTPSISPTFREPAYVLSDGGAARIQLERLPGYAPDLNPDGGIWNHLKYTELKNVCCTSLAELRVELRRAKERLRNKKHVILGCIRHSQGSRFRKPCGDQ